MLTIGIRGDHDWFVPGGSIEPEGFIGIDSNIGENARVFAEVTATAERIAGMAGIKVTW